MNFSKLGSSTWSNNDPPPVSGVAELATTSPVLQFQADMVDPRYSECRLKEVLAITRESSQRQLVEKPVLKVSSSLDSLMTSLNFFRQNLQARIMNGKLMLLDVMLLLFVNF